jgi:hypothetical protein
MSALVKYEAAVRAIAECKAVDEVKAWADKAAAMQAYGRMAKDKTLEVDAAEIRIRAERRLGEMLTTQKVGGGLNRGTKVAGNEAGKGQGSPAVVTDDRRPKLADAGISKDLSSRAQKLAAVPEAEFEAALAEKREIQQREGERVTARLEKRGEEIQRERPAPVPDGRPVLKVIDGGKADAELQAARERITALEAENDDLRDLNAELARGLEAYTKNEEGEPAAVAEIKRLNGQIKTVLLQRDDWMRQCAEMKSQIKSLQRQLGRRA